jgi:hypothetical protein
VENKYLLRSEKSDLEEERDLLKNLERKEVRDEEKAV